MSAMRSNVLKTVHAFPLFVVTVFAWSRALAEDVPEGLLYVAHFDDYAGANWAVGTRTPAGPIRPPTFVQGKFGKALLLTKRRSFSIVGDDGNFDPAQGSVQMWICPNWDGNDGNVRNLFNVRVEQRNYLNFNKLADGRLGVATGSAGVGQYQRVDKDISGWKSGEWHHVAFTWGEGKLALFIDGEKIGEVDGAIPPKRCVPSIAIGTSFDGAIDELAIWKVRKDSFERSSPISAPDMGAIELPAAGPPPVGELDRFHFTLPPSPKGYVVVGKQFVDEVDPDHEIAVGDAPKLSTFAARDEWQSLGFVIYAARDLASLKIEPTPLHGPDGAAMPMENVSIFLNRRVLQRTAPRTPEDQVVPVAALLDPCRPFELPKGYFKEVTVTVRVPPDAQEGIYRGSVNVSAEGGESSSVPLEVRVLPFRLVPSRRKEYGVYYELDLNEDVRESVCAELQDMRNHAVMHLFSYLSIRYQKEGEQIITSYEELDEGLSLLREFGFSGTTIIRTGFQQLAQLLGHKDVVGERATGESLEGDETFALYAERAIRGLAPLKEKYGEFELVVTHMDEVLGRNRLPLYIRLTKPIRRVPEQRVYITLHTMPRPNVPEMTQELDPYVDIRCYNGHALDLWIQAGHSFEELAAELRRSGDEGWVYYNPHRPFFIAKWARIVNGLYLWWSPLHVHCPYRYRTCRTYPYRYVWNMAFSFMSMEDFKTPIATRQWEGYRLGVQDTRYFCMLEDLVAQAGDRPIPQVREAGAWLDYLRGLKPRVDEIQDIPDDRCKNYPLLYTTAERLNGKAFEELRLKTANHIIAVRRALGLGD